MAPYQYCSCDEHKRQDIQYQLTVTEHDFSPLLYADLCRQARSAFVLSGMVDVQLCALLLAYSRVIPVQVNGKVENFTWKGQT